MLSYDWAKIFFPAALSGSAGPSNVDMSEPVLDVPLNTEFKINIEGGVWEMTISNFNIEGASAQTTLRIVLT